MGAAIFRVSIAEFRFNGKLNLPLQIKVENSAKLQQTLEKIPIKHVFLVSKKENGIKQCHALSWQIESSSNDNLMSLSKEKERI